MKIDFYEEFPTKKNLEKLRLIKFNTRLFIFAHSLKEFKELGKKAKKINKKVKCAYWPTVKNSYWVSPFSNTEDLLHLFNELKTCKNQILIDLELPLKNKRLFLKNFFRFRKNKKLIYKFLEKNKKRITTAQGLNLHKENNKHLIRLLGLDYPVDLEKSQMWYSSMAPEFLNKWIKKHLTKLKNKQDFSISLGTIAVGIFGNEPILPPRELRRDLEFVKKAGFSKVIIFRLGGLNKEYMKIIKEFL